MSLILEFSDPRSDQPWTARLIEEGDSYGLEQRLTHEGDVVVEFYDRRYAKQFASQNAGNEWGQFVSRYYVETLRETRPSNPNAQHGLNLDGGTPTWSLGPEAMVFVHLWLDNVYPAPVLERDVTDGLD